MNIAVFCGSKIGARPEYTQSARDTGIAIAQNNCGLVYGGTRAGLMQIVAQSARDNGAPVIGVMARGLGEIADENVADMRYVETLAQRKAMMADLSDAFITLPGGLGTLDEWSEIVTWSMIGLHSKPVGILNVAGYYDDFLRFLERAVADGFWKAAFWNAIVVESDVEELVKKLMAKMPS